MKRAECTGRLQTTLLLHEGQTPTVISGPTNHNHEPPEENVVRGCAIAEMRKHVKAAPLQQLKTTYDTAVSAAAIASDVDTLLLPSYQSVETILKRQRSQNIPKLPKSRRDIRLEGDWSQTSDGSRFLLHSPSMTDNEIIVYASDASLLRLANCKTIYMDGTFKCCPSLYTQLFTIHGLSNNFVVPLVYALLSDKSSASYYKLFDILRQAIFALGAVLDPKIVVSDFESGLVDAMRVHFPQTSHSGCHFHYTQAVYKKVQDLGLTSAYKEKLQENKIKEFVQLCMALAFIPKSEVVVQFNECVSILTEEHRQLLERFIVYFRDTWAEGLFAIKLWNKYGQDFLHRTNNRVESWHSTLKQKLPTHPNVFLLVTALKKMEDGTRLTLMKADAGESPPRRRPKYIKLEEKLVKMHQQHQNGEINTAQLLRQARHFTRKYK